MNEYPEKAIQHLSARFSDVLIETLKLYRNEYGFDDDNASMLFIHTAMRTLLLNSFELQERSKSTASTSSIISLLIKSMYEALREYEKKESSNPQPTDNVTH
jgi:hypothetical protein